MALKDGKIVGYQFPALFKAWDQEQLRQFVIRIVEVGKEMGVTVQVLEPETDEERQVLMKMMGSGHYDGTSEIDDPTFRVKK